MKKIIILFAICFSVKINAQSKKMIYFNADDKPVNMGSSQLVEADSLQSFIKQRKEILPEAKIVGNKLYFYTTDTIRHEHYAIIVDVPNDFEN